jgi:hypothetical protein
MGPTTEDCGLACALQLGWRIAHLYALADDDLGEPLSDTLLPLHESLEAADQLELQVRTAAGDARRAGSTRGADALDGLKGTARAAPYSDEECLKFRGALWECHVEIDKELWASSESGAKAYELGNGLSDTYNRICRAYRDPAIDLAGEWQAVFGEQRIARLKECLHDLQSRLDPRAVTVVSDQLDAWRRRVSQTPLQLPEEPEVRRLLRRQTIIWRQLLIGDKRPEAFLDRRQRAGLRRELARLVWKRYLPCLPGLAVVVGLVFLAAVNFSHISRWYEHNLAATGAATLLASVAGALGITVASVGLTVRTRMSEWTDLLWSRAVSAQVTAVTLTVNELLPPPRRGVISGAGLRVRRPAAASSAITAEAVAPNR